MAFRQVINYGKLGVRKVERVLASHGYKVTNREDLHVDYDLTLSGGDLPDPIRVEVKFDSQILWSGNVSAEWWDDRALVQRGWLQSCGAELMLYLFDCDWAYAFSPVALREFALSHLDQLEGTHVISPDAKTDRKTGIRRKKETLNILIPISMIRDLRLRKWESMFGTPVDPPTIGRKPRKTPSKNRTALTHELLYVGPTPPEPSPKVKIDDYSTKN